MFVPFIIKKLIYCSSIHLLYLYHYICNQMNNPYKSLGISNTATNKEIKEAHRLNALKYHPDKNNKPGANEKFTEINDAKNYLLDEEKRKYFDRTGKIKTDQSDFGYDIDINDFIRKQRELSKDINVGIQIPLSKIYKEETIPLNYNYESYNIKLQRKYWFSYQGWL